MKTNYLTAVFTGFAVVTALSLVGCGGGAATDVKGLSQAYSKLSSYKVEIKNDKGPSIHQAVKLKNGQFSKLTMKTPMGKMYFDIEKKCRYVLMGNSAMKMPVTSEDKEDFEGFNPTDLENSTAKLIKNEKINGVDCLVFEESDGGETITVWIGATDGLVRKMTNGKSKTEFVYTDINSVNDSEFELPEGTQVKDMGQMMGGLFNQGGSK